MKLVGVIVFWSPLHGQGQTSNLHNTALVMNILYKKKVLMMQTQYDKNNLESPLVGQNVGIVDSDNELFQDIGLNAAVTYRMMNKLNLKIIESCCLTFQNSSLLLLPGSDTKNRETFNRDIGRGVIRMIKDANELVDVILIDTNSGDDDLSFQLMSTADLIVVNLTQRRYVLDKFISEYGKRFIDNKKVFYLFGDYDDNSTYNINNCRVRFRNYFRGANSGVIPYCTKYMDAQNESNILNFMKEGLSEKESELDRFLSRIRRIFRTSKYLQEETDYFFHSSILSVEKMYQLMNVSKQKTSGRISTNEFK